MTQIPEHMTDSERRAVAEANAYTARTGQPAYVISQYGSYSPATAGVIHLLYGDRWSQQACAAITYAVGE